MGSVTYTIGTERMSHQLLRPFSSLALRPLSPFLPRFFDLNTSPLHPHRKRPRLGHEHHKHTRQRLRVANIHMKRRKLLEMQRKIQVIRKTEAELDDLLGTLEQVHEAL